MKTLQFLRGLALLATLAVAPTLFAQRNVTISVPGNQITTSGSASIDIVAQGNENALGFSITFNPAVLRYDGFTNGTGITGATVNPNVSSAATGKVGYAIALPAGQKLAAGSKQLLVLNFTVLTQAATSSLAFGDSPIGREVSD